MKDKFQVSSLSQFIDMTGLKGDEVVTRKQFISDIKVLEGEERTIVAKISTSGVDADKDVIYCKGCDCERFSKNPVVHINHSHKVEDVVAKATEIAISDSSIMAKIVFATTQRAEDCWQLIKGGFVRANSIGFIIKTAYRKGEKEFDMFIKNKGMVVSDTCSRIITEFELIENSIVSIPCNPLALIQAVSSKGITLSDKTITELELDKFITKAVSPVKTPVIEQKQDLSELKDDKPIPDEGKHEKHEKDEKSEKVENKVVEEIKSEVAETIKIVEKIEVKPENVKVEDKVQDIPVTVPVIDMVKDSNIVKDIVQEQVIMPEIKPELKIVEFKVIRLGGIDIKATAKEIAETKKNLKKGKIV